MCAQIWNQLFFQSMFKLVMNFLNFSRESFTEINEAWNFQLMFMKFKAFLDLFSSHLGANKVVKYTSILEAGFLNENFHANHVYRRYQNYASPAWMHICMRRGWGGGMCIKHVGKEKLVKSFCSFFPFFFHQIRSFRRELIFFPP